MNEAAIAVDVTEITGSLISLRQLSDSIVVKDAPTCLAAKTAQRDVRNFMKDVHLKLDPFVESAKRNLQTSRDELNRWLAPAEAIDAALAQKVKDFERREREAAEAETRRINEERRIDAARLAEIERKERERAALENRKQLEKQLAEARREGEISKREMEKAQKAAREAEERERIRAAEAAKLAAANVVEVKVAPSIPTVAGVPSRRNYKARVTNGLLLLHAYVDAYLEHDPERVRYLAQFIQPNEQALGVEARKRKGFGASIPGIEFFED